jgi:predicted nucleic acid-binding protein
MRDKIFLDSNIVLYSYSKTELDKNKIANNLIFSLDEILISTQVINEVTNILYKKFKLDVKSIENVILEIDNNFKIVNFSLTTQIKAIKIKDKYRLQYYDSLILATALENGCTILYSEDMQHEQIIENQITIINPFELCQDDQE